MWSTGSAHENFELINHDVVEPLYIEGGEGCCAGWCLVGGGLAQAPDGWLTPVTAESLSGFGNSLTTSRALPWPL